MSQKFFGLDFSRHLKLHEILQSSIKGAKIRDVRAKVDKTGYRRQTNSERLISQIENECNYSLIWNNIKQD